MGFDIDLFVNLIFHTHKTFTIMLNSMLLLVGIMNIMKINQYQIH